MADELPFDEAIAESRRRARELVATEPIIAEAVAGVCQAWETKMVEAGLDPARRDIVDAVLFGLALGQTFTDSKVEELTTLSLLLMAPEPGLSWSTML